MERQHGDVALYAHGSRAIVDPTGNAVGLLAGPPLFGSAEQRAPWVSVGRSGQHRQPEIARDIAVYAVALAAVDPSLTLLQVYWVRGQVPVTDTLAAEVEVVQARRRTVHRVAGTQVAWRRTPVAAEGYLRAAPPRWPRHRCPPRACAGRGAAGCLCRVCRCPPAQRSPHGVPAVEGGGELAPRRLTTGDTVASWTPDLCATSRRAGAFRPIGSQNRRARLSARAPAAFAAPSGPSAASPAAPPR